MNKWTVHEVTAAYYSESNGEAKVLNRTLTDIARTILSTSVNASESTCPELFNTACYISNRLNTRSCGDDKIILEVIYGKRYICRRLQDILGSCTRPKDSHPAQKPVRSAMQVKNLVEYFKGNAYRVFLDGTIKLTEAQYVTFLEKYTPQANRK